MKKAIHLWKCVVKAHADDECCQTGEYAIEIQTSDTKLTHAGNTVVLSTKTVDNFNNKINSFSSKTKNKKQNTQAHAHIYIRPKKRKTNARHVQNLCQYMI